jgi:hypothetical protein
MSFDQCLCFLSILQKLLSDDSIHDQSRKNGGQSYAMYDAHAIGEISS